MFSWRFDTRRDGNLKRTTFLETRPRVTGVNGLALGRETPLSGMWCAESRRIVGKLDTVAGLSSGVQCRCGRSRHLESVACSRGSARSFGLKRARAETESVPVRRPPRDTALRMSSEGREAQASQYPLYGRTRVPRARPPSPSDRHPRPSRSCLPAGRVSGAQVGSLNPLIDRGLDPARHRHCPGVAGLAFQVNDRPVVFPLLDVAEFQVDRFVPPKPAGEQDSQQSAIAFAL